MVIYPNHKTNNDHVLMYIEGCHFQEENYHFKGWIAHDRYAIKYLKNQKRILVTQFDVRVDVHNVYPELTSNWVGIQFSIYKDEIESELQIVLNNDEIINDIGNLYKWVVKYSGFNNKNKDIIVVDNFYKTPDLVRDYGLKYVECVSSGYHKGKRAEERYILEGTKEIFEEIIGRQIVNWGDDNYPNGTFQYCTSQDQLVYHVDLQSYAAIIYLTPNAPIETGTSFYKSKITNLRVLEQENQEVYSKTFKGISDEMNFYDSTQFELVDVVGNVYNRLVLFNSKMIHAASKYFGDTKYNSRFFHIFFFDIL